MKKITILALVFLIVCSAVYAVTVKDNNLVSVSNITIDDSIKIGTERFYSTTPGITNLSGEFHVEKNVSVFELVVRNPGSIVIGGFVNGTAFSRISAVEHFLPEENASRIFVTVRNDIANPGRIFLAWQSS